VVRSFLLGALREKVYNLPFEVACGIRTSDPSNRAALDLAATAYGRLKLTE